MLVDCKLLDDIVEKFNSKLVDYPYRFLCDLDYNDLLNKDYSFDGDCIEDIKTCQYENSDEFSTLNCFKIAAFDKKTLDIVGYLTFSHNLLDQNMEIVRIDHSCSLKKTRRKKISIYLRIIAFKYAIDNKSISAIVSDTNDLSGKLLIDKFKFTKYSEKELNKLYREFHSSLFASGNTFKIINEEGTDDLVFKSQINKYFE